MMGFGREIDVKITEHKVEVSRYDNFPSGKVHDSIQIEHGW